MAAGDAAVVEVEGPLADEPLGTPDDGGQPGLVGHLRVGQDAAAGVGREQVDELLLLARLGDVGDGDLHGVVPHVGQEYPLVEAGLGAALGEVPGGGELGGGGVDGGGLQGGLPRGGEDGGVAHRGPQGEVLAHLHPEGHHRLGPGGDDPRGLPG